MGESTLKLATDGKAANPKKLQLEDGRYVTRGAPRSGRLASVYCATDTGTGETVALKVSRTGDGTAAVNDESFRREVQALIYLKHSNIIRILDSWRSAVQPTDARVARIAPPGRPFTTDDPARLP